VSRGEVEPTQRNLRTGEIDVLAAKLFYDRDHPEGTVGRDSRSARPYSAAARHGRDQISKLPPLKNGLPRGPSPQTDPSVAEPPPRPV
jgi:hypothetical protein